MKKILPLLLMLLGYGSLVAQNHCKGVVKDSNGKTLEFVAVMLTNVADSSQFIGTATDVDGKFDFPQVPYPSFFITASVVGYNNASSGVIQAGQQDTITIVLTEATNTMNEFTLETRVNKIEIEPGKVVMNVENTTLSVGNNALDLIRKMPGVFVDNDGNISVKGKKDVMVYIDGRPTYMSGTQLKNFLKTLSASNISKIEVITQPGANYDAEGNAGIINITLRKKITLGFNGTVEAWYGQGFYPKGGGSFSFNYGKGKVNIYGSYSFSHWRGYIQPELTRPIDSALYSQNYFGGSQDNSHNIKLNFDYEVNKKWTIGTGINVSLGHNLWTGSTKSTFQNLQGTQLDSTQLVNDYTPWNMYNVSLNFNTQWKIDTLGQKMTINADGGTYIERTSGTYQYKFLDSYGDTLRTAPDRTYTMNPNLYLVSGKVDYENPHVFKKFKFEAGIKSSYVTNQTDVTYKNRFPNGSSVIIPGMTNQFIYEENINAFYLSLKRTIKKWTFNAGLRGEHTNITGTQVNLNQVNRQNYFSFFPSAGIAVNPNENHSLSFMYSRRIDRPEYSELNPFIYLLDNYSSFQGNPLLRPQFSNNFELSYTLFQVFTLNTSYTMINNSIIDVFRFDSLNTQRLVFSKANIGSTHNFTAGGSFMMPVTKWWFIMINGNAIYNSYSDATLHINNQGWYGLFSGYFEFTLPKKFTIEMSGYFMTQHPEGQQIVLPNGDFSAGISKKLFKDKLVIKFNVSDIFRTTKWRTTTTTQYGDQFKSTFWWDSRVYTFALSWNFGTAIKEANKKDKDALFDRVGGGR
jgi:iron complex outermembrane receptor protein